MPSAYERYKQSQGGSTQNTGSGFSAYDNYKKGITIQLKKPKLIAKAGGSVIDTKVSALQQQLQDAQAQSKKSADFLKMPWWKQIFQPEFLNKDVAKAAIKEAPKTIAKKTVDFVKSQAKQSGSYAIGTEAALPYANKLYKKAANQFSQQTDIINNKIKQEKDPNKKARLIQILNEHVANAPKKTDFNEAFGWSKKQILAKGGLAASEILSALPIGSIIKGSTLAAEGASKAAPILSRPVGELAKEGLAKLFTKEAGKAIGKEALVGAGYGGLGAVAQGETKVKDIAKSALESAAITPLLAGGLKLGARGLSELAAGEVKTPFKKFQEEVKAPIKEVAVEPKQIAKPQVDSVVKSRSIPKELSQLTDIAKKTDKATFTKEYSYLFDENGHKNFKGTASDFYDKAARQNKSELTSHPIVDQAKKFDSVDAFSKEIQKVTSGTGKNLLPNELKIRQNFEDYAKNPAIQEKYPNGATKAQIISDLYNKSQRSQVAKKAVNSKFQSRVFDRLKQENPGTLKGDLGYEQRNLKADAEKAVKLIAEDKQKAFSVAMDNSHPLSVATNIALAEKARTEGNYKLYGQLIKSRSLEQTRRGQALVAEKGSISDNSTSRYVKELINSRLDTLGEKYTSTIDPRMINKSPKEKAMVAVESGVKKLESKIKNKKLDTKTAVSLLDKLTCLT